MHKRPGQSKHMQLGSAAPGNCRIIRSGIEGNRLCKQMAASCIGSIQWAATDITALTAAGRQARALGPKEQHPGTGPAVHLVFEHLPWRCQSSCDGCWEVNAMVLLPNGLKGQLYKLLGSAGQRH